MLSFLKFFGGVFQTEKSGLRAECGVFLPKIINLQAKHADTFNASNQANLRTENSYPPPRKHKSQREGLYGVIFLSPIS